MPDSENRQSGSKPASFRFWAIASAIAAAIAIGAIALKSLMGPSSDPALVISLQGPDAHQVAPTNPATPTDHSNPGEPPAATTNALIAADGTIVIEPSLVQAGPDGPLPVIAPDGRKPMDVYAARFDVSDTRPRVSIVVTGLGLSDKVTQAAIDKLPPGMTLAITPYGQGLQNWTAAARAKGQEVVLEVPMEPFDYPDNDPGPHTLMTGQASVDNPAQVNWILSRVSGYAGVINVQGGKFLASTDELRFFLSQVASRGLYMLDAGFSQRSQAQSLAKETSAAFAPAQLQLDKSPSGDAVEAALEALTNLALEKRVAIGVISASPGAIDRVAVWARSLEARGVVLSPVSAAIASFAKTAP